MVAVRIATLGALLTLAAPAAAEAKLEFNLPAQIYLEQDKSAATEVDKNRCEVVIFVEYPKIKHAVSYRIIVKRTDGLFDFVAPPFETGGFTKKYPPPKGFGRFFQGAYSTGDGCPAAIATVEGRAVIVSAKVSLDKAFQKRFRDIDDGPWKPVRPKNERVTLTGPLGDPRMIIVRRRGTVTVTPKGSNQPQNEMTNSYAAAGTIVKTGPKGVVKIGSLSGGSVLVGPNTTVQLTRTGFKILERPAHATWTVPYTGSGPDPKVRTNSSVLSVRG